MQEVKERKMPDLSNSRMVEQASSLGARIDLGGKENLTSQYISYVFFMKKGELGTKDKDRLRERM